MDRQELVARYGAQKVEEIEEYAKKAGIGADQIPELMQKDERTAKELLLLCMEVEAGLRRILIEEYGTTPCCKRNYMYELSNSVGNHQNPLACDSSYPYFIADHGTVADYVRAADFDTLIRVYMLYPRDTLIKHKITPVYENASGNLFAVCRVKHTICHGGSVLGGFGQGNRYDGHGDCVINGKTDNSLEENRRNLEFLVSALN